MLCHYVASETCSGIHKLLTCPASAIMSVSIATSSLTSVIIRTECN